ncbi:MAG TPA: hypothetical protein VFX59_12135 [Polyangiales bacterium]|nr:hypothetical protein [Polyangiales bacterium]
MAARFPDVFARAALPGNAAAFKREYGTALARFEAARVRSPARVEIARAIVEAAEEAIHYGEVPLREALLEPAPTPVLQRSVSTSTGAAIEIPFEGRTYRGRSALDVVEKLRAAHQLTDSAYHALRWIIAHEQLDLRGQRFALLGAGAELASTELLLRAGAEVLWIDVGEPPAGWNVTRAPGVGNLLEQPREIAAAIRAFAADGPVHVGMFAYAPGASKEWRLGAAMNAIVRSLEPGIVRSVSLLISPTTPALLGAETRHAAKLRKLHSPSWQRILARTGLTAEPGWLSVSDTHVSLSTVSLQGASYQAAQYIAKIAAAETFSSDGLTVSANVAGITRTRSLSHPLFSAAFLGAGQFGVRIFDPATTRALNGLLMLHDLLNADAPVAQAEGETAKAEALLSQQIHGGVYGLPWVLEGVIRVAAALGLASKPMLLLGKTAPEPVAQAAE